MRDKEKYNAYMREYHIKRYYSLRNGAIVKLGGECILCGGKEGLQLDHIDPKSKEIDISKMLNVSLERFWKEVSKCQLLCKACHAKKTVLERGQKIAKGTHGTLSSYRYCKCDICKKAKSDYTKANKYRYV